MKIDIPPVHTVAEPKNVDARAVIRSEQAEFRAGRNSS